MVIQRPGCRRRVSQPHRATPEGQRLRRFVSINRSSRRDSISATRRGERRPRSTERGELQVNDERLPGWRKDHHHYLPGYLKPANGYLHPKSRASRAKTDRGALAIVGKVVPTAGEKDFAAKRSPQESSRSNGGASSGTLVVALVLEDSCSSASREELKSQNCRIPRNLSCPQWMRVDTCASRTIEPCSRRLLRGAS